MKTAGIVAAILFLLLLSVGTLNAGLPPALDSEVYILDGANPLSVGTRSAVTVIDWNNDNKKDLVVGDGTGYVWLFLNQGTDLDPLFNGGSMIESNGVPIRVDISSSG